MVICDKCGKEKDKRGFAVHYKFCIGTLKEPEIKEISKPEPEKIIETVKETVKEVIEPEQGQEQESEPKKEGEGMLGTVCMVISVVVIIAFVIIFFVLPKKEQT